MKSFDAEPVDNGTLVLVPCVNPKTCPTHNPKLKKEEKKMTNALSTEKEIREDILENWKWIVEEKYPEDYITQLAESQCPINDSEIIAEWIQLPSENSNKFSEIMSDIDDSITIEGLMATDLYLYYTNKYSRIYYDIIEEKKKEESND